MRRDDDFIAGLEVAELRGKLKRGHAVHHRKAMLGPDVFAERLLEGLQMLALRQRFRVPHGFHDHSDLFFGVLDRTSAEIHFDVHKMSCLWLPSAEPEAYGRFGSSCLSGQLALRQGLRASVVGAGPLRGQPEAPP